MYNATNMNAMPPCGPSRKQRGFALFEALISIVVLALGILGVLGVQIGTLAESQNSVRRAHAVRVIEDLAERVKSNPGGFNQLSNYVFNTWSDVIPTVATDCASDPCNPDDLAAWDLQQWRLNMQNTMPAGTQAITFLPGEGTATNRRQLGVMIGWRLNERSKDAGNTNFAAPFEITGDGVVSGTTSCPTGLICHLVYIQP